MRRNEQTIRRIRYMIVIFLVFVIVSLVVIFGVIWRVNARTQTLSTRIKLNAYYGITESIENSIIAGDIDEMTNYGMEIALDSLNEAGIEISQTEKDVLVNELRSGNISLIQSESISTDEDGSLTELSKSYMVNTIAGAVVYTLPNIDTEMLVDAGTTTYSKVLGIKDSLSEVKENDDLLINMQNSINELSSSALGSAVSGNEYTDYTDFASENISQNENSFNSASKEKLLRALETLIEVNSYNAESSESSEGKTTVVYKTDESAGIASENASQAVSVADNASETAGQAVENANQAKETAGQAADSANQAKETAGQAVENASQAKETADQAKTTANQATGSANQAKETADQAKTIANQAAESANQAKLSADKAGTDIADVTQTVSRYYDELSKQQQEILTQIEAQLNEINTVTSRLNLEDTSISSFSSKLSTIDSQISILKDALSTNSINETENISNLQSQISSVNSQLLNINQLIETTKESFEAADKKLKEELETKITNAVDTVTDDMNTYIESESGYMKTSYIGPVRIGSSGEYDWEYENEKAIAKIYDSLLIGCENVQVNYSKQYDINPKYYVDAELGILMIAVDESEATDIEIGNIVILSPGKGGKING